jgi:hypothetical protein
MLKKFIQTALLLVVLCTTATTYAQIGQSPEGIQFQALATDANGHPAAGRVIYVKDAIVAKTATGTIVYSETFKVTASSAGIFTIVLGKGTYASGVTSIANIDWANGPFFLNLKIAVEPTVPTASWNVNNEYVDLGTSQFWSVPYALYAGNVKGADAKLNISDTAAMLKPYFTSINLKANIESPTFTGTVRGVTKAMVGLGNVDNTADLDKPVSTATQAALDLKANAADVTTALALKANAADVTTALDLKVDKVAGKALSTNDYTTAEKTKLAAITGTNTGDQDLSALAIAADVNSALALKANTSDVNTALALKANASDVTTALALKANAADVTTALDLKVDKVSGKALSTNDYTTAEKTKLAAIAGTNTGDQDLSALATNTALALKANTADLTTGLATKVDKVTGKTLSTNDYTTAEKTKLAAISGINTGDQDLSALATNTALALKANTADVNASLSNKENESNKSVNVTTDAASDTKYPSVKAVKTYVDAQLVGSAIADATASLKGKIQLTGDLAGTADAPTVPGLALKANTTDVNTALALKANAADLTSLTTTVNANTASITATAADLATLTTTVNANTASITANTSDIALKANTTDVNTALALKAPLASPALSGVPTAPTASAGTNSTQIATTEYTNAAISSALSSTLISVSTTLTSTGDPFDFSGTVYYNGELDVLTTQNLANGVDVLKVNQSGIANVGFGIANLYSNTTGSANTSVGYKGLYSNSTGKDNSSFGAYSLYKNTNGSYNSAFGSLSLISNTTGSFNSAFGEWALLNNTSGIYNVGIGNNVLFSNTIGSSNTASGVDALKLNTTGNNNTAIGRRALASNTTASNNTAIGNYSLYKNTTGSSNSATGLNSLYSNTVGGNNTAHGSDALNRNTTGNGNTANGSYSLYSNTTANDNTANGYFSLYSNTTGQNNTASGGNSLKKNTTGSYNTANGYNSLLANTTGESNTSIGSFSLERNSTGSNNIAIGYYSLNYNTTAGSNTAIGNQSLSNNSTGEENTANGYKSLRFNTGSFNTANGTYSLESNTTGAYNTALGYSAGRVIADGYASNSTSDYSVYLGSNTKASADDAQNEIVIGYNAIGGGSNTVTLGNSSIATLRAQVTSITSLSDRRDKAEITSISEGIDFVKKLNPVTFTWNTRDKAKVGIKSAGFIAQELLALQKGSTIGDNLDLVSDDNPEKLEARYTNLLPVMVKAIQDQQELIEAQQKQIAELKLILETLLKEKK